jgi:hypothetical protein
VRREFAAHPTAIANAVKFKTKLTSPRFVCKAASPGEILLSLPGETTDREQLT